MKQAMWLALVAGVVGMLGAARAQERLPLIVSAEFPGGSVAIRDLDHQRRILRISPAERPELGAPVWWYFRVEGIAPGETLTIEAGPHPLAAPDRAFYRTEQTEWTATAPGERRGDYVLYRVKVDARTAWFACAPPFASPQTMEWIRRRSSHFAWFELGKSGGRGIYAFHLRDPEVPEAQRAIVWVQARQQAWAAGSSWVCQGLLDWLLSDDLRAAELRRRAEFYFVPVLDADLVERGASGLERSPHDLDHDWSERPAFAPARLAQQRLERLIATGRLRVLLDLRQTPHGRETLLVLPPSGLLPPGRSARVTAFAQIARTEIGEPLPFRGSMRQPAATSRAPKESSALAWVLQRTSDSMLALAVEAPWNAPGSDLAGYRRLGADLGRTLLAYLREPER